MSEKRTRTAAVQVVAPARLHLGFLDLHGGLGRRFGGIGLSLQRPATELVLTRAAGPGAEGPEAKRALAALKRIAAAFDVAPDYHVSVRHAIPAHAGLGSGTQLALAVGTALARLTGVARTPAEIGEIHERGARSAIGIAAFAQGGFIIDGGKTDRPLPPPVLMRLPFPTAWRVLLVTDAQAAGVSGDRELAAFAKLAPFPASAAGELCRIVLMQLAPALIEADLANFGAGLTRIQQIVGAHFAAAQGGSPWTSGKVGTLIGKLGEAGAVGLGQSSWGPTGFAFTDNGAAAERLYSSFVEDAKAMGLGIDIVAGRNSGAHIAETR